ncbi:MAG: type IV secretion system protein [Treponema sp.]|nr:type IV secretion system protein [Treponema sp.]MBQ5877277.1 type IV secretion system protein [Treponema sp.]
MAIKNYLNQGEDPTPFNPQLQHFDLICGQVMKENRILKYVVIVACLSFFLSIAVTFYAVSLPESIPVLVTMNDFGETKYIGPVSRKNYQNFNVPEIACQQQVRKFIELFYSLSTDKNVMNKNLKKTYSLLTSTTAKKFSALIKEQNLFEDFGSMTREVIFTTNLPLKLSKDSYQVDFKVISRQLNGNVNEEIPYRAVVTLNTLEPSEEDILNNPLGIYITGFDIQKLMEDKK